MIKVSCDACGASFTAKDELAGRRGKCPTCKEPIVVPELSDSEDDEAEEEEAQAAPVVSSSGRRRGSSRRSGSRTSGRTPRKKDHRAAGAIFAVVAVLIVLGGYFALKKGDPPSPYSIGLDLMQAGEFDAAIAEFDKVGKDSPLYSQALEKRAEVISRKVNLDRAVNFKSAENLYSLIASVEKNYVSRGGKGHLEPNYAPNTRYLLKRCKEFKDRYPASDHVSEIETIEFRYSDIASLSKPPTEADTRAEMNLRLISQNPGYKGAMAAVEEFSLAWPDQVEAAREMRNEIVEYSINDWKQIRAQLESSMTPGSENWQRVANKTSTYISKLEEVPGLEPVAEARALYKKATDG